MSRCVIISACPVSPELAEALRPDDFIIACDAGYRNCAPLGRRPNIIVGDFDTAPCPEQQDDDVIVLPHVKDDTDTEYAAKLVSEKGFDEALLLGGLGGIVFITAGVSEWRFEYGVAGFGFLALAVMIFGQWKPTRIALAALLFGLFRALSNVYAGFDFLKALNIPSPVYNMMPYIISLVVLAFTSKKSRAPKAEGIPYDKGQR